MQNTFNRHDLAAFVAGILMVAPGLGAAQQSAPVQAAPAQTLPKMTRENTVYKVEAGKWAGPRLADGQPDVQGSWSNTIGNHGNLTDPQGGQPGENRRAPLKARSERAPSRVSDPADGQVPFLP